jgi:hypothetical protein
VHDSSGREWLTLTEAITDTRMSRSTIKTWMREGLETRRSLDGKLIAADALYARLRRTLTENPRVKTRWLNRQTD